MVYYYNINMEREYHNLHDYFTTKYPRDFDDEMQGDVVEFKPLLNKLYELFKGMKISNDFKKKIIDNPKDISCPNPFGSGYYPELWNSCILCLEMSEFEDLKGFANYDEGIFNFGFSKVTPEIFINDIQKIMKYNPEFKSVGAIFRKYVEIKTPLCVISLIDARDNSYKKFKKRINELWINHPKKAEGEGMDIVKELNDKNVDPENKINKISEWLKKNSGNINFSIGKELYDIINS